MRFWLEGLGENNGFPIRSKPGVVDISLMKMVNDASKHMAGGVEWIKDGKKEGS